MTQVRVLLEQQGQLVALDGVMRSGPAPDLEAALLQNVFRE
jgi:hypothetical protein